MSNYEKSYSYNYIGDRMKKAFEIFGTLLLICISFIYTEKITTVIKENNEIMINLNKQFEFLKEDSIDAIINNNTIIPGLSGLEIDIEKSYKKMNQLGYYNENLIAFKKIKPNISIEDNYDKYIIKGNSNKKMVSLVFIVNGNDNIDKIINLLNQEEIKANFFVDSNWFENNNELIISLINQNHIIGSLSGKDYIWMNSIIKKVGNQEKTFCYYENDEFLVNCSYRKSYTIKVDKIENTIKLKENLGNGSIIAFDINTFINNDLNYIINYIKSKGYTITNLVELLEE